MKMNFQHKPTNYQKSTQLHSSFYTLNKKNKKIEKVEAEKQLLILGNRISPDLFRNMFSLIKGTPCQSCPHSQN